MSDQKVEQAAKPMHFAMMEDRTMRGGAQLWYAETVRRLIKKGHTVTVIAPEGAWVADDAKEAGAVLETYSLEETEADPECVREKWAKALENVDSVFCIVRPIRGKFQNVRFVADVIDKANLKANLIAGTGTIDPKYIREQYGGPLIDKPGRSFVCPISKYARDYINENFQVPLDQIVTIYQGTELSRFAPDPAATEEAKKRYPVPEGAGPVLSLIGSYEQRKGQTILLEAVQIMKDKHKLDKVQVVMVGEGPDEEMLKGKIKEMKLEDNVTMYKFTKEPRYVYERADIIVLSSFIEGLPNVCVEALAMGKPQVCSAISGVPEVCIDDETGFCVEAGKPDQLADAVAKLWNDKDLLAKMSENGRKLAADSHDKHVQFLRFEELLVFVGTGGDVASLKRK